jgi:hypothetical protein
MNKISSLFLWVFIMCSFALSSSDSTIMLSKNLNKPETNKSDSITTKENENNTIIGNDTISTINHSQKLTEKQIRANARFRHIMLAVGIFFAIVGAATISAIEIFYL